MKFISGCIAEALKVVEKSSRISVNIEEFSQKLLITSGISETKFPSNLQHSDVFLLYAYVTSLFSIHI